LSTDRKIQPLVSQFVPLKVETNGEAWQKWARQYPKEGSGIPIIYIVRADGKQLYGKSGGKSGAALITFMQQQLQQSGRIFSDAQLAQLTKVVTEAKAALAKENTFEALKKLSSLKKLGTPGNLGSYAEVAVAADTLVKTLTDRGKAEVATAQEALLAEEPSFDDALAMAEVQRIYSMLPAVKTDITKAVREIKKNPSVRDMLKQAESIDRAGAVALFPGGKPRAIKSLERLASINPGSPAAQAAAAKLEELTGKPAAEVVATEESERTWSDNTGKFKLQATLLSNTAGTVRLKKPDGKVISLPVAKLSKANQQYLLKR
jgi:hypothetical protein